MFAARHLVVFHLLLFSIFLIPGGSRAAEDDFYDYQWLSGEKVYVIQNKRYLKKFRFGLDLDGANNSLSPFQNSLHAGAKLNFHFSETIGIGLSYRKYWNSNSTDMDTLINELSTKPLVRKIDQSVGFEFVWYPFYGKINFFNEIGFFDWGFGLSGNYLWMQNNALTFASTDEVDLPPRYSTDKARLVSLYCGSVLHFR